MHLELGTKPVTIVSDEEASERTVFGLGFLIGLLVGVALGAILVAVLT